MNPIALLPRPLRAAAEIVLTLVVAAGIAYLAQAFVVISATPIAGSGPPSA